MAFKIKYPSDEAEAMRAVMESAKSNGVVALPQDAADGFVITKGACLKIQRALMAHEFARNGTPHEEVVNALREMDDLCILFESWQDVTEPHVVIG